MSEPAKTSRVTTARLHRLRALFSGDEPVQSALRYGLEKAHKTVPYAFTLFRLGMTQVSVYEFGGYEFRFYVRGRLCAEGPYLSLAPSPLDLATPIEIAPTDEIEFRVSVQPGWPGYGHGREHDMNNVYQLPVSMRAFGVLLVGEREVALE